MAAAAAAVGAGAAGLGLHFQLRSAPGAEKEQLVNPQVRRAATGGSSGA